MLITLFGSYRGNFDIDNVFVHNFFKILFAQRKGSARF